MRKTMFVMTALNLAVSGVTLAIVLVGSKKLYEEVEEVREKTNKTLKNMRRALEDFEL